MDDHFVLLPLVPSTPKARGRSGHWRRLLLATPPLHQIAERVERRLQALLSRIGTDIRLPGDWAPRRSDIRRQREVCHHLRPGVISRYGKPSRVGPLVCAPLNAMPGLVDVKPAIIFIVSASDFSVDLDATLLPR